MDTQGIHGVMMSHNYMIILWNSSFFITNYLGHIWDIIPNLGQI